MIVSLVSENSILSFFCSFSEVNLSILNIIIIIITLGCLSATYFMQLDKYTHISSKRILKLKSVPSHYLNTWTYKRNVKTELMKLGNVLMGSAVNVITVTCYIIM